MSNESQNRIDVAVAVVFNRQGDVLWGCRPAGKPYAGYWEFPGGKVEPGETVWQALVRELQEELGITAQAGGPWFVIEHDYEHAKVRLHVYRVWAFEGVPASLENQGLAWASLRGVAAGQSSILSPILPATEPLLPVLAQPTVMAVTHYGQGFEACALRLAAALPHVEPVYVQFREKDMGGVALRKAFEHCEALCLAHAHRLLINSACFEALQDALGVRPAYPLHLTAHHLQNRPLFSQGQALAGASVHDSEALSVAFDAGLHYAVLGAVKETPSHVGQAGLGWAAFQSAVSQTRLPVYAIGGLKPADLETAMAHGAHGIAMLSQFSV